MKYFSQLYLDILEAYVNLLNARHLRRVARFHQRVAPLEARVKAAKNQADLESSDGVAFDGTDFRKIDAFAKVEPAVESEESEVEVVAEDATSDVDESTIEPVIEKSLIVHPELGMEPLVFTDDQVSALKTMEGEFGDFGETTEMAMKLLDPQYLVVAGSSLNFKDHFGMIMTPADNHPNFKPCYFVQATVISEDDSLAMSRGQCREIVQIMVIHEENSDTVAINLPSHVKWNLHSRPPRTALGIPQA